MVGHPDLEQAWTRIEASLRSSLPDGVYNTWLADLQPLTIDGRVLYVQAPDRILEWVGRRFAPALDAAAAAADPSVQRVQLVGESAAKPDQQARTRGPWPTVRRHTPLSHTFETFVIGPGNQFAHAAALAVAEMPSQAYNPLLVLGPPGVGKTHLLQAIGSYVASHEPRLAVHYATAETFTSDFTTALRRDDMDFFKASYRHNDMLLLDDAQFLIGKARTAEEFFHTIDAACASGTQVVISADRSPAKMPMLEARLRERLEGGLIIDLSPPDVTTRLTIARRIAATNAALAGTDDVLLHVARRVTTNVRVLQGALIRLSAYSSLTGTPVTLALAERVLNDLYEESSAPTGPSRSAPTIDRIKDETCNSLEVGQEELSSNNRSRRLVYARQIAMYLSRELTDLSLPAIAQHFGGRDHTTVLHAHRKIKRMLIANEDTKATVSSLITSIQQHPQEASQLESSPDLSNI